MLLIVRALDDGELRSIYDEARGLDLDCLVEVHDGAELERALQLDADVIGINNRDLDEGTVDVRTTYELMPDVPAGKTVVAESGISAREELEELERVGVDAVLIGEALMRSEDPEALAPRADRDRRKHARAPPPLARAGLASLGDLSSALRLVSAVALTIPDRDYRERIHPHPVRLGPARRRHRRPLLLAGDLGRLGQGRQLDLGNRKSPPSRRRSPTAAPKKAAAT